MNVPTLLTMAVLVGWLATLITHAETDDVSLPDFAIAVSAAALAGGLLAPWLGIPATGEFGLTLSGTLFSWGCATIVLAAVNLLRFGRSEEHTSELQSRGHLVCRLLLEKKKAGETVLVDDEQVC